MIGHFKKNKVDFVSEIDIALARFNRDHDLSQSQLAECAKYEKIFAQRDQADESARAAASVDTLW